MLIYQHRKSSDVDIVDMNVDIQNVWQNHRIDVYGSYFGALRPSELSILPWNTQINTVREIELDFQKSVTIDVTLSQNFGETDFSSLQDHS